MIRYGSYFLFFVFLFMSIKRLGGAFAVIGIFSLLSGCTLFAPEPTKNPQDMVRTGISNFVAKQSGDYDFDFDISLLGRDGDDKPQNATIHVDSSGDSGKMGDKDVFNTKLFVDAVLNGDAYKLDGELRGNNSAVFAFLKTLSGPEELLNKEMVSQFTDRWWKIPLPDTSVKQYKTEDLQGFFQVLSTYLGELEYDGADGSPGTDSYRYVAKLDNVKVKELLLGFSQSQGRNLTDQEKVQLDDFLKNFRGDVKLWVAIDEEILNRAQVAFTMDKIESADGKALGKGSVRADLTMSNFGKEVAIVEPPEAFEYDVFGKFGDLFGLATLNP